MNNKNMIVPVAAILVAGTLLYGAMTQVKAADNTTWRDTLVETLANKLGVSTTKVDTAMGEIRQERREQGETRFAERLDELVTLGKINESQKSLILAKKAELQKEWDAEQVQRVEHRAELQKWASDNGIDLDSLGLMGLGSGNGLGGGRGMRGNW